jgi:hypothetical protein
MSESTSSTCAGYMDWTLERIIQYCGYTNVKGHEIGTPFDTLLKPISKEYTSWMNVHISYCLAKILFQIRDDEIPIKHIECYDVLNYIRPYSELQSELEACMCDTWSEKEHMDLIQSFTHYTDLGLTMNIAFVSRDCSCKIPAMYPIPLTEDGYENRRWEHRSVKDSSF